MRRVHFIILTVALMKLTAYDSCVKCTGKTDGITASGRKAKHGVVACNWMKFGTKVDIKGMGEYVVRDRGAKSQFGDRNNRIPHIDIWKSTHEEAKRFGVRYAEVTYG